MDISAVVHLIENAVFYVAGILLAICINSLSRQKKADGRIFGICGVLICSAFLALGALHGQSSPEAATSGSDAFEQGRVQGYGIMSAVFPGLCVILLTGIFGKQKKKPEAGSADQMPDAIVKPKKKLGDRIATAVFWVFAGLLLLVAVGAAMRATTQ